MLSGGNLLVSNSSFTGNSAELQGGALMQQGGTTLISATDLQGNKVSLVLAKLSEMLTHTSDGSGAPC
jgi:hypothetical protein